MDADDSCTPLNSPIPLASLPSCPLPQSSLPVSPSRPPNLHTVIARLSPNKPNQGSSNSKTKDGLIRMLLQSHPLHQSQLSSPQNIQLNLPELDSGADSPPSQGYIARLCGTERILSLIQLDHCYSKPWNWKPESSLCQPTKTLFVPRVARNSTGLETDHGDEYPDVVTEPLKPGPPYDPQQAYKVMNECERFASFANPRLGLQYEEEEDLSSWEEGIPRDGWSPAQAKLFSKVIKVLTQDRLARLALEGQDNEPVLRRLTVDRSAKRARAVLAAPPCLWDKGLVQWLQGLLTSRLPRPYLSAWLDILQTLRAKLPSLVERILAAPTGGFQLDSRTKAVSKEGLALLLNRPWDPAANGLTRRRLARLPGNPILVVAPPGPADPRVMSRRMRLWNNQLGCLGKVIVINMPPPRGEAGRRTPVNNYLYQMVSATLSKVREIKHTGDSSRPVILLGWGVGAAIAAHVAGIERLAGLVCLGFPVSTLAGWRGQAGDSLIDIKTPVLFVMGEKSGQAGSDDIEDLRERLSVETGLVIVGGADDNLRLSKRKKKTENVTQCMVDRCVMDEIRDFLVGLLSNRQPNFLLQQEPTFAVPNQELGAPRKVKSRKRNSSDSASPLSPTKRSRGVTPSLPGGSTITPGGDAPQALPAKKPARKPKKSKSADSGSTTETPGGQNFPVIPSNLARLALPASLLSISSPLPQVPSDTQISPPGLTVRPPPSARPLPRPHSPTRVIQYAAGRTTKLPLGGQLPSSLPTSPTGSISGSRLQPISTQARPGLGQVQSPRAQIGGTGAHTNIPRGPIPGGLAITKPLTLQQAQALAHDLKSKGSQGQVIQMRSPLVSPSPGNSPEKLFLISVPSASSSANPTPISVPPPSSIMSVPTVSSPTSLTNEGLERHEMAQILANLTQTPLSSHVNKRDRTGRSWHMLSKYWAGPIVLINTCLVPYYLCLGKPVNFSYSFFI